MELDFKILTMMELRRSPGEILDRVYEKDEAFIIERSGRQKACLVPIAYFLPDIPKDKVNNELDELRQKGEKLSLTISDTKELVILLKEIVHKYEVTLKILLPHGYPNNAPKIFASPGDGVEQLREFVKNGDVMFRDWAGHQKIEFRIYNRALSDAEIRYLAGK